MSTEQKMRALIAAALEVVTSVSAEALARQDGYQSFVPRHRIRELAEAVEALVPGSVERVREAAKRAALEPVCDCPPGVAGHCGAH